MKKNEWLCLLSLECVKKLLRIMRLMLFLLLVSFTVAWGSSYSQVTKFNLDLKNSTVRQILLEIEEQSEFVFIYRNEVVDVDRNITIDVKNATIEKVLDVILKDDVEYVINNRQIIIKEKESPDSAVKVFIQTQKKTITGKVTDDSGASLPGVSIIVKGTTIGVTTDTNGNYSLKIPDDAKVLVFSFVGMKNQEIPVAGKTILNVVLKEETVGIDEVVAIGYGSQNKKDITGSIATIKAERMTDNNPVDVLQGIQGKVAGVMISSSSGDPGAGSVITIRGFNSISAGTSPLFIIDGMPYDVNDDEIAFSTIGTGNSSNPLDFINPADIKSISVLKDASATAIYGSRGSNGVIIIETKEGEGKKGQAVINISSYIGFDEVSRKIPVLSGNEFIEYRRDIDPKGFMFFHNGDPNKPRDPYELTQHNWQDEILRTGLKQNYDLSFSGKSDKTTYSGSLGFLDNEAIVKNNDQQKYTMRLNFTHRKNEKLYIGLNTTGTYSELNGATQSGGGLGLFNGVVQNLVISNPVELYNPTFDPGDNYISPTSMIDNAYKKTASMRLNTNVFVHYSFGNGFKLIFSGGGTFSSSKGSEFYSKKTNWGVGVNGYSNINDRKTQAINGSVQLHYSKYFNENSRLNAFIASEINNYSYEWFSITNTNFLDESTGVFDISKGSTTKASGSLKDKTKRVSFFGRINYTFHEKHIFTATFRKDGSDKFGPGNRYGYFPSGAYSWLITEEGFMKNQSILSLAKLRLSYGLSGNDRIPSYRYLARLSNSYYNGILGMTPSSQANDNLKWETTYQSNIGIDLGFLKNTLSFSIDFYKKETHDMLIPTPVPGRTGYSSQWQNIGRIDNKGVEFQLSSINVDKNDFQWTTDLNISSNKNTVIDLGLLDFIPVTIGGAWIRDISRVTVGRPIGEAYGYVFDGVYQINDFTWQNGSDESIPYNERNYQLNEGVVSVAGMNVKPGSHKFKDLNGDGKITLDDDRQPISSSQPIFFGGITNKFKYKNFDLNIFFEGSYGNEVFNESKFRLEGGVSHTYMNVTKDFYYNHWSPENPSNTHGDYATRNRTSLLASSYYVEDASYLRLKSLSLGYSFRPKVLNALKLKQGRVYILGNNLITWTKYTGFDPEVNSGNLLITGVDRISYPRSKTILFGINLTF